MGPGSPVTGNQVPLPPSAAGFHHSSPMSPLAVQSLMESDVNVLPGDNETATY